MTARRIHLTGDGAHDDRRAWRRRADLVAELAACQAALAAARAHGRRLVGLLGEQAAELVVLRAAMDAVRTSRRETA